MPSDYESIARDNVKRWGDETNHLALLAGMYTNRTHFIFELLQNAEDAKATAIHFSLRRDRLEVLHDGRYFTERDVRAISGVGRGTKVNDLTQIGKFGIGFKSVYAYTTGPYIHSGDEHFCIEGYIRPRPTAPIQVDTRWTTLFVIPFNPPDVTPDMAFTELSACLRALPARTLLFLHQLAAISWSIDGVAEGKCSRAPEKPLGSGHMVELQSVVNSQIRRDRWLTFSRPVPNKDGPPLRVEAAFQLTVEESTGKDVIVSAPDTTLVVFFPTEKETHLGFLIQGPYQTTPARDNIPIDGGRNRELVLETAALLTKVLPALRDLGLLSVEALECFPLAVQDFPPNSMFRPLYDSVRSALTSLPLLPTSTGGNAKAQDVRLGTAELIELFTPQQLGALLKRSQPVYWLDQKITERLSPVLFRYLVGSRLSRYEPQKAVEALIPGVQVDAEHVVRRLSHEFLTPQTDQWMLRLYRFLFRHSGNMVQEELKRRPFLRLSPRRHVAPFDNAGRPMAYLPSAGASGFDVVQPNLVDLEVRFFLQRLGLTEPDPTTEVIEHILPRYELETADDISAQQHRTDLERIAQAVVASSEAARGRLIERLKETEFLLAENMASGETKFCRPEDIYPRTPELEAYFHNNGQAWLVVEDGSQLAELLGLLGVPSTPRIFQRPQDRHGYVVLRESRSDYQRGVGGFDPEAEVFGLQHALTAPHPEISAFIWNRVLIPHRDLLWGTVESATVKSYSPRKPDERKRSRIGDLLATTAWLPARTGGFHKPPALTPDQLPQSFHSDEALANLLGMRVAEWEAASRILGLSIEDLQLFSENREELQQLKRQILHKRASNSSDSRASAGDRAEDFGAALEEKFNRPGATKLIDDGSTNHPIQDPEKRRIRIEDEIKANQQLGPVQKYFGRIPTTHWEGKLAETRAYLAIEYRGGCQICRQTFPKVDGRPYFEGLYLVPRHQEQWLDRPGNVLCLCPNCCAKLQFGAVEVTDLAQQILAVRMLKEGGTREPYITITLLGVETRIRYTERHLLDVQVMIKKGKNEFDRVDVPA